MVIELKNATDENATVKTAFSQLQTYKQAIPSLFTYNALLIVSDGWDALCGTVTSDWGRFMSWKTKDGITTADALQSQMEVMFTGMLNKQTLLDLIHHFIVFEKSKDKTLKKVAAYHQYYAVNKAVSTTQKASAESGDRRAGVVWHTQGSGKSLSMVFYTGKLVLALDNPTIVVLTDRNDLDDQLFETFTNCQQLLRQEPQQAEDRKHLRTLLSVASGGVVFTTIQKFMPADTDIVEQGNDKEPDPKYIGAEIKALSERKNIVVIADEAHRSQYDFLDGFAKHLRDALPHASFIGFTGTPIESSDRNTQAVFGNYVDNLDKISIAGYSLGGYIALYLAYTFPDKIEKIVTLGTKLYWDTSIAEKEVGRLDPDVIEERFPGYAAQLILKHTTENWKKVLSNTAKLFLHIGQFNPLSFNKFNHITCPVLLMLGDRDTSVTLVETTTVYKELPNAQLAVLPHTKHAITEADVVLITYLITSFLNL